MFDKKQTCVHCHFFVKEVRNLPTEAPIVLPVSDQERQLAKRGDFTWAKDHYALSCSFGVWDEGFYFNLSKKQEEIVEKNRKGFCFYWPFRHGMFIPAAKVLQEREARDSEAARDRRLTIWGLWIAAMALVVDLILGLVERFGLLPNTP
jgi:hypothetical protein